MNISYKNRKNHLYRFCLAAVLIAVMIFISAPACFAQSGEDSDLIDVDFVPDTLFNEAEILPGDSVMSYALVTNKTAGTITAVTMATEVYDPYYFGDVLNIVIKKGEGQLYSGTLSNFFNTAEAISLGSLAAGETAKYDYTVSFIKAAGNVYNNYQENPIWPELMSLQFDIKITAQSESDEGGDVSIASFSGENSGSDGNSGIFPNQNPKIKILGDQGYAELVIEKTTNIESAKQGEKNIPFKIIITNNGNMAAYGVVLNDTLPEGLVFSGTDDTFKSWPAADIGPGEIKAYDYTVDILDAAEAKIYTNIAVASEDGGNVLSDTADLEVESPWVLGFESELFDTGFSVKEFIYLLLVIGMLIVLSWKLRQKYIKD